MVRVYVWFVFHLAIYLVFLAPSLTQNVIQSFQGFSIWADIFQFLNPFLVKLCIVDTNCIFWQKSSRLLCYHC